MKKGPSYWHIILLGFIAAVLSELTNFLIAGISDPTVHFLIEAIKFLVIIIILAILYHKFYLKKLPKEK